MKLIVLLTSTKKTISHILPILQSWDSQSKKADMIFLSLSTTEFKNYEGDLPKRLVEYIESKSNFSIIWNNKKIFNRLYPIISYCDEDDLIVLSDENTIFKNSYLEMIYNKFKDDPTRPVQPHNSSFYIGNSSQIDVISGCILKKRMLSGCQKLITDKILNTNAEFRFYSCYLWLNGYRINQLKNCINMYSAYFNIDNTKLDLNESNSLCTYLFKWSVSRQFNEKLQFNLLNIIKNNSEYREKEDLQEMQKQIYMIFYDRGYRAQDNAEHLCRWVMQNRKDIKTAYILDKSSLDWPRLAKEKFNLIDLQDRFHVKEELLKCDYACSSIFNEGIWLDFSYCHCKRVFLNHGCFLAPINYLKHECDNVDLFIAANKIEYDTMLDPYHNLKPNQVALCGQPRQDALVRNQKAPHTEDSILIQFWQRPVKWTENNNEKFLSSNFYKKTKELLTNKKLLECCKQNKIKIIFKMHSIQYDWLQYYKDCENDVVRLSPLSELFEPQFIRSKMIVTDISSNAYEMAKIGKPCIYFEPDTSELFAWRFKKNGGFEFDISKNKIGPLINYSVDAAVDEIIKLINNNYILDKIYLDKRKQQISFMNDSNSCERCLNAILKISKSRTEIQTQRRLKEDEERSVKEKKKKDNWLRIM